jgi:LPXTG-motif cell wall-anchored protein
MARLALLLFSSSAFAHPGHGALEIHWHTESLIWFLVGAVVVLGAGYVIQRKRKP